MEYFRGQPCRSTPIYRRICLRAYLRRNRRFDVRHRWYTHVVHPRRCLCLRVFTGKREGGAGPAGVGGQGLKPLPSQSYHQIAVGARAASLRVSVVFALSLPPSLPPLLSLFPSPSLPSSLARILLLARFVRIHDLNSIAFYLPFRAPSR